MFGKVNFRRMEKKKKKEREKMRRELFGECLIRRGREENDGSA